MKVIFLDIDGVLNSGKYIKSLDADLWDNPVNQMDPVAVARLNVITDATKAKIVVSSSWRLPFLTHPTPLPALQGCMKSYGISGDIIGMTCEKANALRNRRGKEIQKWINDHYNDIEKYVIIDDDSDMGRIRTHQVLTKFEDGLQDFHVDRIIEILGRIA